jgi:hypothetical protein
MCTHASADELRDGIGRSGWSRPRPQLRAVCSAGVIGGDTWQAPHCHISSQAYFQ